MIKKNNIEWRRATAEEIEKGSGEMIKEKEFFTYHDSNGNSVTEDEYKAATTPIKRVLRLLKIIR